jgi:hypothetical protein
MVNENTKLIGKKFNKLTIIKYIGYILSKNGKRRRSGFQCECECGNLIVVQKDKIISGNKKSCGCLKHNKPFKLRDLVGNEFGSLTVLREVKAV